MRRDVDRAVVHLGARPDAERAFTAVAVLRALFFFPGVTGVLLYRLGHLCLTRLPGPLRSVGWVFTRFSAHLVGIEFDPGTHVGPGLFVNHFGTVFVGAQEIGENCNISHGVTIGRSTIADDDCPDAPVIGDRVWIGPGAVVVGAVTLADDAVVGANAVVMKDVPAAGVAIGNPARVATGQGSFRQVRYRGMGQDRARLAALAKATGPAQGVGQTLTPAAG